MRVVFILTAIDHLGPFIIARDIIQNLTGKVDTVEVFYLKDPSKAINFNVKTSKIESFFKPINFSAYDVVHSHGFMADMYVSLHLKRKAKWVSTLHQKIKPNYLLDYNRFTATVLEYVWLTGVRKADCVVTLTRDMQSYYLAKIPATRVEYIYNGIPENVPATQIPGHERDKIEQLKKHTKLLGISARLVYLKGIDQVVRMLAERDDYSLLLIGDGVEKESLQALAKTLDVEARVLFIGYKDNPRDYLALCDAYIMSSRTEGFGLCVLEAASQKLPVVCSDIPVYQELFTDEVVRFQLEDIHSLAVAVDSAIENSSSLGIRVYDLFTKSFTSEIMAEKYFELYSQL